MKTSPEKKTFLDKYGWPVERIKGRSIQNFIRLILHTKRYGYGVGSAGWKREIYGDREHRHIFTDAQENYIRSQVDKSDD